MRILSFKYFLKKYVTYLSNKKGLYLNILLKEAETSNSRLREVLLLYLVETYEKEKFENKLSLYPKLNEIYHDNYDILYKKTYIQTEEMNQFRKIYLSYCSQRDYDENQELVKRTLLKKILDIKHSKKISNYHVYSRLNLNPGNINYVFKHQDVNRISMENLHSIYHFLNS